MSLIETLQDHEQMSDREKMCLSSLCECLVDEDAADKQQPFQAILPQLPPRNPVGTHCMRLLASHEYFHIVQQSLVMFGFMDHADRT